MYAPLTYPLAIDNAQQFFNDLMTLSDPGYERYRLRSHVEAFRIQALAEQESLSLFNQLIGFLDGLVAVEVLSSEQGREFNHRLLKGFESAWMNT